jgi:hypothetical protein
LGHGRRRRQQIRAARHVLIPKGRFGALSPLAADTKAAEPPESPIIRHVQEPERAVVGMLPIAHLLIPWTENDRNPISGSW